MDWLPNLITISMELRHRSTFAG